MTSVKELLKKVLKPRATDQSFEPFADIDEVLVALAIRNVQKRVPAAPRSALINQLGGAVHGDDIPLAVQSLVNKDLVIETTSRSSQSYSLTPNAETFLERVLKDNTHLIQAHLDKKGCGLSL